MNPQEPFEQIIDQEEKIEDMGIYILSDECDAIQTAVTVCKYTACCLIISAIGFIIIS